MDPRGLFTNRAEDYARYRPGYPSELFSHLVAECRLGPSTWVADVGSGTGIFAAQFLSLHEGISVYAVEPNFEMRDQAVSTHAGNARFVNIEGSAEEIPLGDESVELVTAAQSFHWFDTVRARVEFERILKPPGWVALVWNVRQPGTTDFQRGYESILRRWAPQYKGAQHDDEEAEAIAQFFGAASFEKTTFANPQFLFWEELRGRAMSASYFPLPGDSNHESAIAALQDLFDSHKQGGRVDFDYSTQLFLGKIKSMDS